MELHVSPSWAQFFLARPRAESSLDHPPIPYREQSGSVFCAGRVSHSGRGLVPPPAGTAHKSAQSPQFLKILIHSSSLGRSLKQRNTQNSFFPLKALFSTFQHPFTKCQPEVFWLEFFKMSWTHLYAVLWNQWGINCCCGKLCYSCLSHRLADRQPRQHVHTNRYADRHTHTCKDKQACMHVAHKYRQAHVHLQAQTYMQTHADRHTHSQEYSATAFLSLC